MSRAIVGIVLLLASAITVWADQSKNHHNPQIDALRLQIKSLQAEEKVTLKAIKAQYESILQREKLSQAQLEELKTALRAQEKALLALTTDSQEKKTIREEYQFLVKVLTGEVQLDKEVTKQIKQQEKTHLALIRTIYKAKIKELQMLIVALEKKGHK